MPAPQPDSSPQLTPSADGGAGRLTPRDVQRAALRDLVALATESAATEAEIERRYKSAIEEGAKESERANWALEQRYESLKDGVRKKYEEWGSQIDGEFGSEMASLEEAVKPRRQKIDRAYESIEHNVRQKLDQATWLAESVFDVAQNQARAEYKKTKEEVAAHDESVNAMEAEAAALLIKYGHDFGATAGNAGPSAAAEAGSAPTPADARAAFGAHREQSEQRLRGLKDLRSPRLFVGTLPYLLLLALCFVAGVVTQLVLATPAPQWKPIAIAVGATAAGVIGLGVLVRVMARKRVSAAAAALRQSLESARAAAKAELEAAKARQKAHFAEAGHKRDEEIRRAKEKFAPVIEQADRNRDVGLEGIEADQAAELARIEARRDKGQFEAGDWRERNLSELQQRLERDHQALHEKHESQTRDSRTQYEHGRAALERRLHEGLKSIGAPIAETGAANGNGRLLTDWSDPAWKSWEPPQEFAAAVRVGELEVDLKRIARGASKGNGVQLALPETFSMPASLGFPRQASLLIQADRGGRDVALRTLQMAMTRLLTSLPPGRARFIIIDPVGLGQNFAGFMHLADHDEALVGGRIWTESEHIEQRLTNLTGHMETVIQKYLRNEFETIDEYNAQAGELAEPYRFLVIADFPVGFQGDAFRRLSSIASTGARCGVYTLIFRDTRQPLTAGTHLEELEAHSVNLVQEGDKFVWKDDVFRQFPLRLDPPPTEEFLTGILDVVGTKAKEANRVEVPFDTIAPSPQEMWSRKSTDDLRVPIGRTGATRLQYMKLGRGVAQHVLIAGKTGSGKSTLLHALITNLAMWYGPDEVVFYLVDFKKGVEFKTYATHGLPHARAIAVESDREFGLSVLQRLDAELARRGGLFRKAGAQDLASYRGSAGAVRMPRTLLVIDEFQEFFSEDDKLAQDAAVLMDRLVRQGRAFGIHVLLGSQTIGGSSGLARSTIGQMAVRIALQTSEADSQLILGDNNSAARLLTRPGEAIYNDAGGLVEGNSPFQIAWLPDEGRERYLQRVRDRARAAGDGVGGAIVFEGNAPADITKNQQLANAIDVASAPATPTAPQAWLGEPVAIKDPTAVVFRRQSGANTLIVGQQEESAMAMMAGAMIGLAAQHPADGASFYVLDGGAVDSPLSGVFGKIKAALPHQTRLVEWRGVPEAIAELAEEVQRRLAGDQPGAPNIYLLIYGLQRYRALRKQEETFSMSAGDEEKAPDPGKLFADVLREGPAVGVHVIAWSDTPIAVERTLDRHALREFDNRILFQMSASDSSNLVDSPNANKLGFHRALAYSEEQGVMEKFRPYALPDDEWLGHVKARLGARAGVVRPDGVAS